MTLWEFVCSTYARPGVSGACLDLQDVHAQCVPFLLWRMWTLAERRPVDEALLATAVAAARAWEVAAVTPLRDVRRRLKHPAPPVEDAARIDLRDEVKSAELAAERILLDTLEALTPAPGGDQLDWAPALAATAAAWDPAIPGDALRRLVLALG